MGLRPIRSSLNPYFAGRDPVIAINVQSLISPGMVEEQGIGDRLRIKSLADERRLFLLECIGHLKPRAEPQEERPCIGGKMLLHMPPSNIGGTSAAIFAAHVPNIPACCIIIRFGNGD